MSSLNDDVYIRPGPVFPDGYMIPAGLVPVLVADHLIVSDDTWHEREGGEPGDYYAIYEEGVDEETVGYDIEQHLRNWIARSGDPFRRDSRGVALGFMDDDPMGYEF